MWESSKQIKLALDESENPFWWCEELQVSKAPCMVSQDTSIADRRLLTAISKRKSADMSQKARIWNQERYE